MTPFSSIIVISILVPELRVCVIVTNLQDVRQLLVMVVGINLIFFPIFNSVQMLNVCKCPFFSFLDAFKISVNAVRE